MSRPIVLGVAALLLFALGFLAANTHVARGVIFPVTSYEADVNKDTRVNIADLGLVASKYGQHAPTATLVPVATATPTSYCNLSGRSFPNIAVNGSAAGMPDFSNCQLVGTDLSGANLSQTQFPWADLSGADLDGAYLADVDFSNANLSGAHMVGIRAQRSSFVGANLSNAVISDGYSGCGCDAFAETDFTGATTTGADASAVTLWYYTICPDGSPSADHDFTCIGYGFGGSPVPTPTPDPTCSGASASIRWTAGNGHCYQRFDVGMTFADSQADCESRSGYLVTLTSAAENAFVSSSVGRVANPYFWIGLTDQVSEGTFLWVTGEPVSYTNWKLTEPSGGATDNGVVHTTGGGWEDSPLDFGFWKRVCETP